MRALSPPRRVTRDGPEAAGPRAHYPCAGSRGAGARGLGSADPDGGGWVTVEGAAAGVAGGVGASVTDLHAITSAGRRQQYLVEDRVLAVATGPGQRAGDERPVPGAGDGDREAQLAAGFQRLDQSVKRARVQADPQRAVPP